MTVEIRRSCTRGLSLPQPNVIKTSAGYYETNELVEAIEHGMRTLGTMSFSFYPLADYLSLPAARDSIKNRRKRKCSLLYPVNGEPV